MNKSNNIQFIYSGKISLIEPNLARTSFAKIFSNGLEAAFCSRPFDTYDQCVRTVSLFLREIQDQIHSVSSETYTNIFEMNATLIGDSNSATNTPWTKSEIARIYVIKKSELGSDTLNSPLIVSIFETDSRNVAIKTQEKTIH